MKRFTLVTTSVAVSVAASLLIVSVTALSAIASVAPAAARNVQRKPPAGTYLNVEAGYGSAEITLWADGRYTYGDDRSVSTEGSYKLIGDEMIFLEYGPADAACLHLASTYQWALDGKQLTLTAVEDPCPARKYDWRFGEWIREP